MIKYLKDLCLLDGCAGEEDDIRNYIISKIYDKCSWHIDNMGNILAKKKGKNKAGHKVMLTAHMDEVALIVTGINSDGSLSFQTVGGIESIALCGRAVRFTHAEGQPIGVIGVKPIHLCSGSEDITPPKISDLAIDIGAESKEEAQTYIYPGDRAYFISDFVRFGNGKVCAKALDDRFGCAALINMIDSELEFDTSFAFLVQEEVGLRGAAAAAYALKPEYAVVLEATTAADIPGNEGSEMVCVQGDGAVLSFMDSTTAYDMKLFRMGMELAKVKNIPIQAKTRTTGGNDAGEIHKANVGVKTLTVSLPCRYIHSSTSVADERDMDACLQTAVALAEKFADD